MGESEKFGVFEILLGGDLMDFNLVRFNLVRSGFIRSGFIRSNLVLLAASVSLMACSQYQGTNLSNGVADGIIGGQVVPSTEALAHGVVALYDVQRKALCTASIASAKYLITAAHCVLPGSTQNLRVVYGTDITNKATITAVGTVTGAIQSPLWATNQNNTQNTGDIAVVRLASPLPAGYAPVSVLNDNSSLQAGTPVLLAGYGISVGHPDPASKNDNGAGVLRSVVTKIVNPAFSASEVMIDESQGKGACHGDSGGPAYVQVNGKTMLFGVTSRGTDQFCGQGVVYTNIVAYLKWLPTAAQQLEAQAAQKVSGFLMPRFLANLEE